MSQSFIARIRNCIYYDTFIEEKGYNKESFQSKPDKAQMNEFMSYLKDNNLKLKSKNSTLKNELKDENFSNIKDYKYYIHKIIASSLNSDEKIELIQNVSDLDNKKELIQKITNELNQLNTEIEELTKKLNERLGEKK